MTVSRPFTDEEVERVRRLADDGLTDREIHDRTGIPVLRVKSCRSRNKIIAGYYQKARVGPQSPLPPEELDQLRRIEAPEGPDVDRPPTRSQCRDCRQWVRLDDGVFALHLLNTPGVERRFAKPCARSWRNPDAD